MKRSKRLIALMLPVIVCVFIFGWVMYWIGGNGKRKVERSANQFLRSPNFSLKKNHAGPTNTVYPTVSNATLEAHS